MLRSEAKELVMALQLFLGMRQLRISAKHRSVMGTRQQTFSTSFTSSTPASRRIAMPSGIAYRCAAAHTSSPLCGCAPSRTTRKPESICSPWPTRHGGEEARDTYSPYLRGFSCKLACHLTACHITDALPGHAPNEQSQNHCAYRRFSVRLDVRV